MESQLINNFIRRFQDKNIVINWGTLLIGLKGLGTQEPYLSPNKVIDWALERYLRDNDILAKEIAFNSEQDREFIIQKLTFYSRDIDLLKEEKKWVILLLEDILKKNPKNYLEGIIELISFWVSLGNPIYCPNSIQGINNDINPKDYYTEGNYNKLRKESYHWLNKTLIELKN